VKYLPTAVVTVALLTGAIGSVTLPMLSLVDAARPSPAEAAKQFTYRGRDMRLKTPRIPPVAAKDWTPEQKAAAAKANAGDGSNDNFRTAVHNPELARAWWDWLRFVHDNPGTRAKAGDALPLIDKELLVMRTNYLNNDDWVWAVHVPMAINWGRTKEDVARIAKGPDAPGWNEKDAALVRAADELHYQAFVTDRTWNTLTKYYNTRQMLDILFMAGVYATNAYFANSTGIPFNEGQNGVVWSLPADGWKPTRAEAAKLYTFDGRTTRLKTPRMSPIEAKDWTAEQKAAAARANAGDGANNNFKTAIHNPELGRAWWDFLRFVHDNPGTRGKAGDALPQIDKELVVMRTNYLNHDAWVYATHVPMAVAWGRSRQEVDRIAEGPDAKGWNEKDAALVRAADELYYQAFITDSTWNTLTKYYNTRQMLDIIFLAGVYATNAYFVNSTGLPFQPGMKMNGQVIDWVLPE
jgi:4-carboxymuconolactone decarboxylase